MKNWFYKHWELVLIILIGLSVSWPLLAPGYFSHHDDLQVLRVYEMRQCIQDFQLPCRWSKNLGFGNGFPIYNYYGVFPYYVGGVVSFLVGYVTATKILFFMATFGAAISMWLLGRELFGKYPGIVASALYVYAPYRALDIYVRGALAEAWSIALLPLVMYGFLKLGRESKQRWFLLSTISMFALLTSHNIMTLFFGPILVLWVIWCGWEDKKSLIRLMVSFLLGVILSSFFLVPAFMEKGLIQNETLTRFDLDFRVHFVTINQLFFSRFWGYGASVQGPWDGLSFQVGWPHWWLVVFSFGCLVVLFGRAKQRDFKKAVLLIGLFLNFGLAVFMTHNKSAFIWEALSILQFAQFPWRFLALVMLSTSLLGGMAVYCAKNKYQVTLAVLVVAITLLLNIGYFRPDKFYFDISDANKLSGSEWDRQTSSIILDYLPKTAFEPREKAPSQPIVTSGEAMIEQYVAKSNRFSFSLKTNGAKVEMPIFYFPGWTLRINGQDTAVKHDNLLGRISFDVPKGEYMIDGYFKDTTVRMVSNLASLFGVVLLFVYIKYVKNKRINF